MIVPGEPLTRRRALAAGVAAVAFGATNEPGMSQATPTLRIVDPHVHVWTHDAKYPYPDPRPAEVPPPPADDALPETLLALMQANGVHHTVIVHVIYYGYDGRYAADVVRAHPRHFAGVCRVDPRAADAPAQLARWVREYGYRGVRLSPSAGPAGDWINDRKRMDAIFAKAAELEVPLCILCPASRLVDVDRVIERHAESLDVCIDHMADCALDDDAGLASLLTLAARPRVYLKLSHLWSLSREAYPYRDTHPRVRRLYDAFGRERLMWGTDWPGVEQFCGYAKAVALYRDEISFFSDDDRRWIMGGTALKLWPFAAT